MLKNFLVAASAHFRRRARGRRRPQLFPELDRRAARGRGQGERLVRVRSGVSPGRAAHVQRVHLGAEEVVGDAVAGPLQKRLCEARAVCGGGRHADGGLVAAAGDEGVVRQVRNGVKLQRHLPGDLLGVGEGEGGLSGGGDDDDGGRGGRRDRGHLIESIIRPVATTMVLFLCIRQRSPAHQQAIQPLKAF